MDNVLGDQIGHIPRKVAEKLATYMDTEDLVIDGMLTGEKGVYDMPVRLCLYGPSETTERKRVESQLKSDKLVKATELNQSRKQAELERKLEAEKEKLGLDGEELEDNRREELGLKAGGTTVGITREKDLLQVSLEELHKLSEAVNFRQGSGDIVQSAMDEDALSQMPMAEQPDCLVAQLLPYQLQVCAHLRTPNILYHG